jgi:LmbE family N-acetylglucosaminyl deacetylase
MMARRGVEVSVVVATRGDKGTADPTMTSDRLATIREEEQRAAAEVLGARLVEFLGYKDGELVESLELRGRIVGEIRRTRPDVLLTFDPTPGYRQHPDHRVVGRASLDAAWPSARDRLSYPGAGPPHETAEAWLFAGPKPTLIVDVSAVIEEKIAARLRHASQTPNPAALRNRWRRMAAEERFAQVDLR